MQRFSQARAAFLRFLGVLHSMESELPYVIHVLELRLSLSLSYTGLQATKLVNRKRDAQRAPP